MGCGRSTAMGDGHPAAGQPHSTATRWLPTTHLIFRMGYWDVVVPPPPPPQFDEELLASCCKIGMSMWVCIYLVLPCDRSRDWRRYSRVLAVLVLRLFLNLLWWEKAILGAWGRHWYLNEICDLMRRNYWHLTLFSSWLLFMCWCFTRHSSVGYVISELVVLLLNVVKIVIPR